MRNMSIISAGMIAHMLSSWTLIPKQYSERTRCSGTLKFLGPLKGVCFRNSRTEEVASLNCRALPVLLVRSQIARSKTFEL